ncbi:MAG: CarD family transcriptional regulator [Selenomonadaceae bacterium]|nr:CarD family transcriptional regulator [Selenomonadaceae bacterium]
MRRDFFILRAVPLHCAAILIKCKKTFRRRWHELKIGDKIVYPMHGAGEITDIEENEVGGVKNSYYIFRLPIGDMKLMLPVDKVEEVGLRELIAPAQVNEVIEVLRAETEQLQGSWNKRFHTNLERLKSGDIFEAAAVARNLTRQNNKKKVSSGEKKILDLSRQILITELVYVCDKSPEEITAWIDELIDIPEPDDK